MTRDTRNFVYFFSRFAKRVGSSKTNFDFLAKDFSEWTGVNSRRSFAVCAGLLSTRPTTRSPNPSSLSCYTRAFTYSPAIPSGKLTMQPAGTNLKVGEKLMCIAVPEAGESYFQIGLGTSLSVL